MSLAGRCIAHINLATGFCGGERQTELLLRYLAEAGWQQLLVARGGDSLASRCADIPGLDINEVSGGILSASRAFDDAALIHVHQGRAIKPAWLQSFLCRQALYRYPQSTEGPPPESAESFGIPSRFTRDFDIYGNQ